MRWVSRGQLACGPTAAAIVCIGRIAGHGRVEVNDEAVIVRKWSSRNVAVFWREVKGFALTPNGKGGAWRSVLTTDGRQ